MAKEKKPKEISADSVDLLSAEPQSPLRTLATRTDGLDLLTATEPSSTPINVRSAAQKNISLGLRTFQQYTVIVRELVISLSEKKIPMAVFHERCFYQKSNVFYLLLANEKFPSLSKDIAKEMTLNVVEREMEVFLSHLCSIQQLALNIIGRATW